MGKALVVAAVVVTLVRVVISSESPVVDAAIIEGTVLLLGVLWSDLPIGNVRRRR